MGAQPFKPRNGSQAFPVAAGTIESLQVPLGRVLVNVGLLLNDTRGFPPQAMELLDAIHNEAVGLYETVSRLAFGESMGEAEVP
jgi:hypothetical protein